MAKYFGTDGIRGAFGAPHMCPAFAFRLANALAKHLKKNRPKQALRIVIGRDTRASGQALTDALVAGFECHSVDVFDGGVIPTPAVARSVIEQCGDLGIAVTASHNPADDNGIKLFDSEGRKFDETEELAIEELVDEEPPFGGKIDVSQATSLDATEIYIRNISSLMPEGALKGWKIVLDTANGATFQTSPAVLRGWGADVHVIGDEPDGSNINAGVGSECPDQLASAVVEFSANIGIAHDGDGDRLVICDEKGTIVDGDILLALLGAHAMKSGELKSGKLVATVHSNLGLDRAIIAAGGQVERVDVGDRNVAKRMRELGASIGGESSGHIIFSDYATTGDGLLAAVKVIELVLKTGKLLSELGAAVELFPQATKNMKVVEKLPLGDLKNLSVAIAQIEEAFGEDGRVLVRYSGTEPKLRMLVECNDILHVDAAISQLEQAARNDLSVIDS